VTGRRHLLLVEDNPMDVELTLCALARAQCEIPIDVARDGEEVLELIAAWQAGSPVPIVIFLDLNLPRVSGLTVLRSLKENAIAKVIPVVALSTSAAASDIRSAYALGASSYVVKEFDFDRFSAVAALLTRYWTELNLPCV
jgi:CheY-like chemotaxis protein